MMNTTMNRQQRKTVQTDMSSMMISLQHNNLILRPNLKPKTTSHSQNRHSLAYPNGLNPPLSIEFVPCPFSDDGLPANPLNHFQTAQWKGEPGKGPI